VNLPSRLTSEEEQVDASGFQKQEGANDNKQPQDQKTSSGRNVQDKENNINTPGTLGKYSFCTNKLLYNNNLIC